MHYNGERKCLGLDERLPIFSFKIGSFPINITYEVVLQWVIILILGLTAYLLTRNLKRVPSKKQVVIEYIYSYVEGLVKDNMGNSYMGYLPYVGTIVVYLLTLNFTGLFGFAPATQCLSVTVGLALTSFLVINGTAIKRNGPLGYFTGLRKPYMFMFPLNIMERLTLPVSLSLRLYGNMLAATMLIEMIYEALGKVAWIAQIGAPIFVHGYFDLFDGTIQMLVFMMLTINYIKLISEEH